MAEKRASGTFARRKLTQRESLIMFFTMLTLAGALVYRFPYAYVEKNVAALKTDIEYAQKDILGLTVQLADLKAREADIKAGRKSGIAGWDLVDQKGVIMVLEGVTAEARREGVNLLSVHPSQEVDKEKYKEVLMNLDLKGRYRELAEYFKGLERLSQIVNIRKLRVEACPDASSTCTTQLEAVTYVAK
jgi:Tfp pilus assembly protein PilO